MTPPANLAQPHPIPMSVVTDVVAMQDGTSLVVIQIASATGVHVVFMDAAHAVELGEKLAAHGKQAKTGIQVAGPGQVPPLFGPNGHKL